MPIFNYHIFSSNCMIRGWIYRKFLANDACNAASYGCFPGGFFFSFFLAAHFLQFFDLSTKLPELPGGGCHQGQAEHRRGAGLPARLHGAGDGEQPARKHVRSSGGKKRQSRWEEWLSELLWMLVDLGIMEISTESSWKCTPRESLNFFYCFFNIGFGSWLT